MRSFVEKGVTLQTLFTLDSDVVEKTPASLLENDVPKFEAARLQLASPEPSATSMSSDGTNQDLVDRIGKNWFQKAQMAPSTPPASEC
jgi:hypothetical protein